MADIADIANDLAQAEIDSIIRNRVLPEAITGSGSCLYCDTVLHKATHRWCDSDCRNDWEKQNRNVHVDMRGTGLNIHKRAHRSDDRGYVAGVGIGLHSATKSLLGHG